ncbi:MAG: hypothetical protein ACLTFB_02450 [Candidatus Phytoplasma pyri]|uniref:hypothetical protein n=1 Tax=Candidatus Phytoplasma pyri TaxID=47566 RepID=UPI0039832A29
MQIKLINLRKIIIVSLLITLSFVLDIFSKYIYISNIMVPILRIKFFIIAGIPLMLMVIILEFRYAFLGIIIYSLICFLNILPGSSYLFETFGHLSGFSRSQWIFLNALTNFFIPCLSYLFLSFSYKKNINNFSKNIYQIFLCLLLMIFFQVISKTFNGYYLYFDIIKQNLNLPKKDHIFLIILCLNLVPNLTMNLFNFFCCLKILFHCKNIKFFKTL